jgi:hypothetical protein
MHVSAEPESAAVQLLSKIHAAGYTVDEFIALLRVDPLTDTSPQQFWVVPPRRIGCADTLP